MSDPYNQWPHKIILRDQPTYLSAYTWCLRNLTTGLWKPDYEKPNSLKFTLKEDFVTVGIMFG